MKIVWHTRSVVGLMNRIIKNKLLPLILAPLLAISINAHAEVRRSKVISIYDNPKYGADFSHFAYVNPKAPQGGKITMPAYGGFDSFNPFIFKGIASPEVAALTLDSLGVIPTDDETSVYPLIAKEFEIPDDHSFIGFIIDEKARFSDGSKITADDIVFSFDSIIKKGAPFYKIYYADIKKIEKINDYHVRFYFNPNSTNKELPLILAQLKIFSAKDWEHKDFSTPSLQPPLGSGPYILERFSPSKFLIFKKNNNYWGKDLPSRKGFFNFAEVRYDYYQDTTVTLQALFAGEIDIREEYIAKNWVSGYNNDIVKSGRIIKEEIRHNQPATLQFFGFNTRLPQFADRRVRQAIGLAFNFDWANDKLFYNQYRRIDSYFANTIMAAKGLPQGKELDILNKFKDQLPQAVFMENQSVPSHKDYLQTRANLRQAVKLLQSAGYDFIDGKMTNLNTGKPLEIEVLSNSANGAAFTRVMLPFIENLKKIGVKMTFRNLETNIFKNRLDSFDFEMAILGFRMSNLPGNELKEMFGSQSADVHGSYNITGIRNSVIDDIIKRIISADNQEDYLASIRALDRVLLQEYYVIPQWYSPHNRVAYHKGLKHQIMDTPVGFDPFTWWRDK